MAYLSQGMYKEPLTQQKPPSLKFNFNDNKSSDEFDLSTAGPVPSVRPPLQPLKTPTIGLSGRNNIFSSRTLSVPTSANRTPLPGLRGQISTKHSFKRGNSVVLRDDQLQRMVELQKKHTGSQSSSRMRARHASAHRGSQLEQKLKEDVDSMIGFKGFDNISATNKILKSERFNQNWSKKHSYVALRSAIGVGRATSTKRRGSAKASAISASRSQAGLSALPAIYQGGTSVLNSQAETPYDSPVKIMYNEAPSELMSQIGFEMDNTSQYHMELLEEKRDEIERIMHKQKRKATMAQMSKFIDSTAVASTATQVKRQRLVSDGQYELPDISPKNRRQIIQKIDTDDLNKHQLIKRKLSVSSGSSTDLVQDNKYQSPSKGFQLQQRIKLTIKPLGKQKPTQPPRFITEPDLETMKRVRSKNKPMGNKKIDVDQGSKVDEINQPPRVFDKHRDAINQVFDPVKVANEMTYMTEVFIVAKGLGGPLNDDVQSEIDSDLNSPIRPEPQIQTQKLAQLPAKTNVKFQQQQQQAMKKQSTVTVNEVIKSSKKIRKSPARRKSSRRSLIPKSERDVCTPDTELSEQYQIVEGLVDKETALNVQREIRKINKLAEDDRPDFIKKALASESGQTEDVDFDVNKSETDTTVRLARLDREKFNPELDIYSDIESVKSPHSPRRRHSIIRAHTLAMRAIPAEESAEERGSDDGRSEENDYEEENSAEDDADGQDDDDYMHEEEGMMDEREAFKKKLVDKAVAKKEDEELCGVRMVKKIDDFVFQVSVEAGISIPDQTPMGEGIGDLKQQKMLETGNTSMFRLENTKNDDHGQYQKVIDKYFDEFRGQQAFFSLCKMAKESKWTDPNIHDPRMQYFAACTKNNSVAKPILSKIIDKALVLRDLKLNAGDAEGLRENFMMDSELINKLYLDQNGLEDSQLAIILEGFSYQKQLVNLTIQGSNNVDEASVEQLKIILKRKVPDHLQELHLIHTRSAWHITEELLRQTRQRNYLRKLSLVEAGLNDFSMVHLCEIVRTQKTLQALDISWNQLRPSQMKPLLHILKKNRRLTSLNLAWNNIMEAKIEDQEGPDQYTRDIIVMIGKIIKHSPTLQHMNLSGTGLSAQVIYEMGTILRRSRATQCLHLSGNPGLNTENLEYLHKRIKCRPNEFIERFTRIQVTVKNVLRAAGASGNIINGLKMKVERDTEFSQVHKNDPIEYSVNDQLVFQRMLGHKEDIPGSGQWYESSKNAVACKSHYKNECWICEGQVYCVLFWSKGMCYKMNPVLSADQTEVIRYEIDREFGQEEEASDLMYENGNLKYAEMIDQVPYICGTFTGWRYRRMLSLEEFNERNEERQDGFDIACSRGQIRKKVTNRSKCNDYETRYVEIADLDEKLRMIYNWRHFFSKSLRYKRPFLLNAHFFYQMPSLNGTLPEDDHPMAQGEVLHTSSDEETEEEKAESEEDDGLLMTREQLEQLQLQEEHRLQNPLPKLVDASKLDKVFILPIFVKPGQHNYMVKYKDTQELHQAHLHKKINKEEKRYHKAKSGQQKESDKPFNKQEYRMAKEALAPQCFFYHCDVPKRTEEIPVFAKPMQSKVVTRNFNKDSSVFKPWRLDTAGTELQAFKEDIKLWKGYRFIKSEDDKEKTEAVLKKHFGKLKDVFQHLAANSVWPNIGSLDFCEFASKSKIMDNVTVNISTVDRTFIGATLKVADSQAPQNGLRRFEFLEILVRLANIKYLETKIVDTFEEATEKLITETVLAHFTPEPWQEFRDSQLWTMDVNDTFDANLGNLKTIYATYKTPTSPNMDLQDCLTMCTQNSSIGISEKEISFCYGYSHATVINEERQWKRYMSLEFVELLEFIGRVAHTRFKNSSPEMASQPLAQKIEFILDDLMVGHGLIRQEVNIEVFEFSESDDDY